MARSRSPTKIYGYSEMEELVQGKDSLKLSLKSSRSGFWSRLSSTLCCLGLSCCGFTVVEEQVVLERLSRLRELESELQQESFNHKIDLALLYQVLPPEIVEAIRTGSRPSTRKFEKISIFFSDVVGYTDISRQCTEFQVMDMLNNLYTVMDFVTEAFCLYKVEST